MEYKLPGSQHFYTILKPGYNTQVPIPKAFCEKLNGEHSEVATLTSCKGTWEVKIEKGSSEVICFGQGWDVFYREHDLSVGNVILFKHCGSMHFTAKIFNLTAFEKEFPVNSTNQSDEITSRDNTALVPLINPGEEPRTSTFDSSHFTAEITSYHVRQGWSTVYMPRAFSKAHGLNQTKTIILRDSTGEEWTIEVAQYTRKRAVMTRGWSDYCLAKQVKQGDSCTFRFRESRDNCEVVLLDVCISRT